jgi:hypothetical protein
VQRLAAAFVPAADEVGALQRSGSAESHLFAAVSAAGHYGARPRHATRQGIYALAPSARLLASINSLDARQVEGMLQRALAAWRELPAEQRRMDEGLKRVLAQTRRWDHLYPRGGLILVVHSRDLSASEAPERWRHAWNRDHAWFAAGEARGFVPDEPRPGARRQVAAALVQRLARCHLVDQVRGQTWPVPPQCVERAELTAEVVRAAGDAVELRFTGATRAVQHGTWSIDGSSDPPMPRQHGVETELSGHATWDAAAQRFTAFELVAVGTRWGGTTYNGRAGDPGPAPIGFVLQLDPAQGGEHIAPSLLEAYGWSAAAAGR